MQISKAQNPLETLETHQTFVKGRFRNMFGFIIVVNFNSGDCHKNILDIYQATTETVFVGANLYGFWRETFKRQI